MTALACTVLAMLMLAPEQAAAVPQGGARTWSARSMGEMTNATFALTTIGDAVVAGPAFLLESNGLTVHTSPGGDYAVLVDPAASQSFLLEDDSADSLGLTLGSTSHCKCKTKDTIKCAKAVAACVGVCVGTWGVGCISCLGAYPKCCQCVGKVIGSCSKC